MNVVAAVKAYVTKMTDDSGPGMKALLMDKYTTSVVSMVYSQSEMLQKEVFLFERIDTVRQESVRHLKCLVFIRPTPDNISALAAELKYPRYNSYYICFSNITSMADIKTLAEADEQEVVREVEELYADYLAISPHFLSFSIPCLVDGLSISRMNVHRTVQGILAVLLSLKKSPVIRYSKTSKIALQVAEEVRDMLTKESGLCSFGGGGDCPPVLLVLDRRQDPVSPLLNQWTYQAMVHELLGITNNRVSLAAFGDLKEVVLCPEQDEFYANNLYRNFGDIGMAIKDLMEEFQQKARSNQTVSTIRDMKAFVESYPMFKKMSGTVATHVSVVDALANMMDKYALLDVSELEQEIVSQDDHSEQLKRIRTLLGSNKVRDIDALRLVALYSLRYVDHSNNDINGLVEALRKRGQNKEKPEIDASAVHNILTYHQQNDLFGDSKFKEKIKKRIFQGLNGVENVFTRHTPLVKDIVEQLVKGKLKDGEYPPVNGLSSLLNRRVEDVIVVIVGGATYEESAAIHQLNTSLPGTRIILAGTHIHDTKSFLKEVEVATSGVPRFKRPVRHTNNF